jgi:uncharacterized protein YukE
MRDPLAAASLLYAAWRAGYAQGSEVRGAVVRFAAARRGERGKRRNMSQAIVDPQELRRFAHNLKVFTSELESRIAVLHGQLGALGQTWRDQEHEKFVQEFEQTMAAVGRFTQAAAQHIPFLLRKAERVEEYLQQR